MEVKIRRYRPEDGEYIAANIRASDRKEIYYLAALTPLRAINTTAAVSVISWTALVDGIPALSFGVCRKTTMSDIGMPWALGTDEADRHITKYAKQSRVFYDGMTQAFPVLENYALAENTKTLRWLKWMGFDMDDPAPYGCFGAMFVRFGKGF